MTTIQDWMHCVLRTGSWRTFDDLHIDQVVPGAARTQWVQEAARLFLLAAHVRSQVAPDFVVVLGFSLRPPHLPGGPPWGTAAELLQELDDSPPSLYLFQRDSDQWRHPLYDTIPLATPDFLPRTAQARYPQGPLYLPV